MKFFLLITLAFSGVNVLLAQPVVRVDTLPNEGTVTHTYLNIQIPSGEMYMQSSQICGQSICKLAAPNTSAKHDISTSKDPNGNQIRTLALNLDQNEEDDQLQAKSTSRGMVSADVSRQILQFNSSDQTANCRSVFNPDPSTSTDLYLDLGIGRSRLDFSDMSLNSVEIHSAFSDVHIAYTSSNRVAMEKMDIHAAKAKIVLKNLEMARADLISIMNDMGDTKVIIGSNDYPGVTIFIQQGMGDCILMVHPEHPTKIVLKNGMFTTSDMADGFQRTDKRTFMNKAYYELEERRKAGENNVPKGTNIICNVDFGNVSVLTTN